MSDNLNMQRRTFLKGVALGGSLLGGLWGSMPWLPDVVKRRGQYVYPQRIESWPGVDVRYSVCRQCRSDCGLEARVFNNVLLKLDGNPYHPNSTEPQLPYAADPQEALGAKIPHSLCARGQAGAQTLYDPYRVLQPLKRTGPRGSGKFKTISWEQLVEETVKGGLLFKDVPGEEKRQVDGFAQLWNQGRGRFTPADPAHPDMGPQTNQLVAYWGRAEVGQNTFIQRFAAAFGSVNALPHVGICELNHHVATQQSLNGAVAMLKPDIANSEFVIWFGAGIYTANFPMQALARKIAAASSRGLKFVLVDVSATAGVAHADRFITVKPGGDGALAMGMVRWILENHRYDSRFLMNTTLKAAETQGEPNYANASYLVISDPSHPKAHKFARAADVGLAAAGSTDADKYVVIDAGGQPAVFDTVDQGLLWPQGDLEVKPTTVGGVSCLTAMQILCQTAQEHTLADYAKLAGVSSRVITDLAREFTSHGKKAVADFYRGPAMHTNGFYNGRSIMTLNFLIGNIDWVGGYMAGGGTADFMGTKPTSPFPLGKWPNQPKGVPNGAKISREGAFYEKTSYYKELEDKGRSPFPAKRPWYPFGFGIWHEIFGGIWDEYPYPAKIVYQHMGNPAYSAPPGMGGADDEKLPWFRMIKDLNKVPLFITDDIVLSETSMYADYIVPDSTFLEAWGALPGFPTTPTSVIGIRQPVVDPLMAKTKDGRPMCFETYYIDVAEKLGMPGFGKNAFMDGGSLHRREDFYLRMIANVAYDTGTYLQLDSQGLPAKMGPVPDATAAEMKSVASWQKQFGSVLTEAQWRKVAYVMARGGRFEDYGLAYLGEKPGWLTHRYGSAKNLLQIYNEAVGSTHNAISGEVFHGTGIALPQRTMKGRLLDNIDPSKEFNFHLTTYKLPIHTQSRTINDPWLLELLQENFIELNDADAQRLGIADGDWIRVASASYPRGITGRARSLPGVRPGVVTFTNSFGHWHYGSGTWQVDGQTLRGDDARNGGVRLNPLMRLDPDMQDASGWGTCLEDPVGGGASYFDTKVKISKL
ncbi:Molybdopterin oxidoreductase Fe4S4 domain protein [Acididesulfobacillus acetoxydans]|uniref:Molybdopterin oxidoreductase Fe4S4 domain protein n=1 Tax=Acididesulfobacillus acetoxydans TaxID=1561005 RepID=A0A8S0W845_9FIRM|nr:molybdopterin-dependent oxidoreductase [Acididesulfobacillus acetoxydans]CAA7601469.1 Molybdopterin oxidoreductase Fe4S4 domain protein [Acididesulfobacillus acetoxydans]CEJ06124.1 Tetrathionate reductase subunit A [Acididesulfobacillus acetoxydans]